MEDRLNGGLVVFYDKAKRIHDCFAVSLDPRVDLVSLENVDDGPKLSSVGALGRAV